MVLAGCSLWGFSRPFHYGTGKGRTGPFLQEKLNKAIRDQICRAQKRLREDLITEDLCHQFLYAPVIQTPTIDTTLVLFKQQSVSGHEKVDIDQFAKKRLYRKTTHGQRRDGRPQNKIDGLLHSPSKIPRSNESKKKSNQ